MQNIENGRTRMGLLSDDDRGNNTFRLSELTTLDYY